MHPVASVPRPCATSTRGTTPTPLNPTKNFISNRTSASGYRESIAARLPLNSSNCSRKLSEFLLLPSYFLLLTSYFLLLTSYFFLLTSYFFLSASPSRRTDCRDHFSFVSTINPKILINRNHPVIRIQLAHADEAEVGEIGLPVRVSSRERGQLRQMIATIE